MPSTQRTLSVILPNYNHARFLPYALEAILGQTRPADEIVVIDDASEDDSLAVIERYRGRHPQFRVVRNARNLGVVHNLNRGLELANGGYVYCAAADDIAHPGLLASGLALLAQHPQAALYSARCHIIDAEGRNRGVRPTPLPILTPGYISPAEVRRKLMEDDGWFNGTCTLWRRQCLVDIGGFAGDLGSFTDGFASRRLALMHGTCFSPEVLGSWRRIEGSFSWRANNVADAERLIAIARDHIERAGDLFPAGYADRWANRHRFGVLRFGLIEARRAARKSGRMQWVRAWLAEKLLTAWYFVRLRPADAVTVARRRLLSALYRPGKTE
jgi:glycosyltransferase involved in cell wall biosynthesis